MEDEGIAGALTHLGSLLIPSSCHRSLCHFLELNGILRTEDKDTIRALGQCKATHRFVRSFPSSRGLDVLNLRCPLYRVSAEVFTRFHIQCTIKEVSLCPKIKHINAHCNERNSKRPPRPILDFDHHIVVRRPDHETF